LKDNPAEGRDRFQVVLVFVLLSKVPIPVTFSENLTMKLKLGIFMLN